jgi:fido (protein-threonine AMPylation protein)
MQTQRLLEIVHAGQWSDRRISLELICDVHQSIFSGVRDFAGQYRDRGRGQEHLIFGPNRSVHRNRVVPELDSACRRANEERDAALAEPDSVRRAELSLSCALRFHAEVVRIHPFEDGNGRTSRALLNLLLVSMGVKPIAFEVPKQEYIDCLNRYHVDRDLMPLLDLALRLLTT